MRPFDSLRGAIQASRIGALLAAVAVPVLLLSALAVPAAATSDTLDQSQLNDTSQVEYLFSGDMGAQTFTAGLTGQLDRIELYLAPCSSCGAPGPLSVTIEGTQYTSSFLFTGITPNANDVLSATTISVPTSAQWVNVPLPPTSVTDGTVYAIVLSDAAGTTYVDGTSYDSYPGGQALHYSGGWYPSGNWDWAFQTYVQVAVSSGSLTVDITGVPTGDANVVVSGTGSLAGTTDTVTGTETLTLDAGTYDVTANAVNVGGLAYTGTVAGSPASVTAGATTSVTVTYALADTYGNLETLVRLDEAQSGLARSLEAKLDAAEAATRRGDQGAVDGALGAFIREVSAQSGKTITMAQAVTLTSLAQGLE